MAQDTAHPTQHTERAKRSTGAKWPRTQHGQSNTPSGHTGEQEPSGPGHRTRNTTHLADTPVNGSQVAQDTAQATAKDGTRTPMNRSQVAQDIAQATQHTERVHR